MSDAPDISALAALGTAILLVAGAAITLIGTLGLIRLQTFYQRVHAPTLGTTLGTACIVLASMVYFSALGGRPAARFTGSRPTVSGTLSGKRARTRRTTSWSRTAGACWSRRDLTARSSG